MIAKRHTLTNALRVAAQVFVNDAAISDQPERLREGFTRQAAEARKLADDIEQADSITLED